MPGYEISNGDVLVNFGDYADITSHVPAVDCPMPESEKLSNYLMRLLAIMEQGGWRLTQRDEDSEKETKYKQFDKIEDLAAHTMDIGDMVGYLASRIDALTSGLSGKVEDVGLEIDEMDAQMAASSASLLVKIIEVVVTLIEIKNAIDDLREGIPEGSNEDIVAALESIFEIEGLSIFKRQTLSGVESVPEEVLGELEEANDNEEVFAIGDSSFLLKSKVVNH